MKDEKIRGDNMTELTEFEKLVLKEIQELSQHIAHETSRLVDQISSSWKSALHDGLLRR